VGGMITLTFANRSQIIVNLQRPLQEVWLAAKSGGYHYRFDGQHWQDTKGQGEFWQQLSADATVQSGLPLAFHGA
jgi:CyaY protein